MILAHRIALNGLQLDEIDERINIKSITEGAGKETISAAGTAQRNGQRITNRRRDTLDITVKFSMLIGPEEMQERSTLLERINTWAAGGGWLTVNYKSGRRLMVVCAQAPGAGDQYEWTNVYQITFRAYSMPYWEDETAFNSSSAVAASGSFGIQVPGSVETDAEVTVVNKSGMTINTLRLNIAGNEMSFTNLNLGGNQTLIIDHVYTDSLYYLRMRIGNRSVLANRAGADEFVMKPGWRSASFTADRAVQVTVSARGRYI